MRPTRIQLTQDSPDWKRWRAQGLGSTAAPVIMLEAYKKPFQLWQEYMNLAEKPEQNRFMVRGKKLEPMAREAYVRESKVKVTPFCYEHPAFPYLRCSTDGVDDIVEPQLVVELKCPDKITAHLSAREGVVPRQYWGQCQHLLMVTGAYQLHYASFWHGELAIVPVEVDEAYTDRMMAREAKFWKMVKDGRFVAPDAEADMTGNKEWERVAQRFREIDALYNHYSELRAAAEAELAQMTDMETKRAFGAGVEVKWTHTVRAAEAKPRGPVDSWSLKVEQIPAERVD